ncbi:SDR family NAD(P)-dependent oxidoreductase [Candidatus Poriferisodalis sp.]|uniref:SDR family NAD(P)-dependent oxidoreductase n=1 Tax=Candidatus Poriferisodalis sp. TaxID=3101277 RepID=UPI003B51C379
MGRLDDRVALVTGASRGIGAAAAEAFAAEGASVIINTIPDERMEALASEVVSRITDAGGAAITVAADVTVPADVEAMVAEARSAFGDIDVLVTNAAYARRSPWNEISVEQWDQTLAVNLRGAFVCAKAVHPGMLRRGRGSIITVTSVMVDLGMAGALDYVASKGGVIGFTRALAREVGPDQIRVNSVMPGAIRTEYEVETETETEEEIAERLAGLQSLPQRGYAKDLAATFVYLACDDSAFVTGQVIAVDGGWVHH